MSKERDSIDRSHDQGDNDREIGEDFQGYNREFRLVFPACRYIQAEVIAAGSCDVHGFSLSTLCKND
jgi:hypothetical protein